jgi:type II secretory pathway pseudopilin PulG
MRYRRAFTIIEALIAIILVGLAIASLVAANGSFTKANGAAADLSTAEFLIEQVRELTTMLAVVDPQTDISTFGPEETALTNYDDLDDFDEASFSPPINANRQPLNDLAAFTQQITVQNVSPLNFGHVVTHHSSNFVRVTVRVLLNSKEISSTAWIRARY